MQVRENYTDHLDRLLDKVAAAASFKTRIPEALEQCLSIVAHARTDQPAFTELGKIVGPRQKTHDVVLRKNAWILQHALGDRSHCVGNYLVFKRRSRRAGSRYAYESPVLNQLTLQGLVTRSVSLGDWHANIERFGALKKLGALCVDAQSGTVYIMQGLSYSQAKRLRPSMQTSNRARHGATLPLFGEHEDRPITGAAIHVASARSLRLAADVIQQAVPGFRVCPVAMVAADPEAGWQYQVHDLSGFEDSRERLIQLDEFPLISSSRQPNRRESTDLDRLPAVLSRRDILRAAPVDRATRCFMNLVVLWDHQCRMPGELSSLSVSAIADEVERRFGIAYSRDLRRHDLEDCLAKLQYIDTPYYRPGEFAITHRGVGRMCLFLASTSGGVGGGVSDSLEETVVHHVMQQSSRWDEYCFGATRAKGQ